MMRADHVIEARTWARIAGALYLVVVLAGIFSLAWVPSRLAVSGDALARFAQLQHEAFVFRAGIAASVVCYLAFLLLPLALYRLLAAHGRVTAVVMVALAAASVPFSFANLLHRLDVVALLEQASRPGANLAVLAVQAQASLAQYNQGIGLSEVFWGAWLLPLGMLIYRSGMIPRALGVLLVLGGCGYLLDFFGGLLVSGYAGSTLAGFATRPAALGEIATCLWLLVVGVRSR